MPIFERNQYTMNCHAITAIRRLSVKGQGKGKGQTLAELRGSMFEVQKKEGALEYSLQTNKGKGKDCLGRNLSPRTQREKGEEKWVYARNPAPPPGGEV